VDRSDPDADRWRTFGARALVVLASLAILLALVAAYARQAAVDSDQFANRANAALHDDSVRSLIAQKVTDEVVLKNEEDLIAARLIDTHYADKLPNGKMRTFFGGGEELRRRTKLDGVSADSFDAALRIRDRLGFEGKGERGMYLCHSFCELGATRLDSVLADLRTFVVASPGAVFVVINQDYVTPEDFVGAVRDADLERFAYTGPVRGRWPTLREMVDRNERVVFLAENQAGAAPWYHLAYELITEETPYAFKKVRQLTSADGLDKTCEPNRGPDQAPLFLLNHWITTDPVPRPSDAAKVNAYDALLARAEDCRRIRSHLPNLVAVNFYRRGDLFRVVDKLNGLD
jgi:hypothetical protein